MAASISLGGSENEKVVVTVLGNERAPTGKYYDDNWLSIYGDMSTGAFSGWFSAAIRTNDEIHDKSNAPATRCQ